jgi:hypothetical protein
MLNHLVHHSKRSPTSTTAYATHRREDIMVQTEIYQVSTRGRVDDVEKLGTVMEEDATACDK